MIPRAAKVLIASLSGLLLAGGGVLIAAAALRAPPSLRGDLDDLLDYSLLSEGFNRLSLKERLAMIKELVGRLKSLDGEGSVLLAGFAAGLAGSAQEQIVANASQLAVDLADEYAKGYQDVPPEERGAYLDRIYLDFVKQMEDLAGVTREVSDQDRLAKARERARKDEERIRREDPASGGQGAAEMFHVLGDVVGASATPAQRGRIGLLMRDMTRHLRKSR